jgi:hypothetical protein
MDGYMSDKIVKKDDKLYTCIPIFWNKDVSKLYDGNRNTISIPECIRENNVLDLLDEDHNTIFVYDNIESLYYKLRFQSGYHEGN